MHLYFSVDNIHVRVYSVAIYTDIIELLLL
jgi:hypothetical protein